MGTHRPTIAGKDRSLMKRLSSLARLALMALLLLPLSACAEPKATVSVSAINYTGQELNTFFVRRPGESKTGGGRPQPTPL